MGRLQRANSAQQSGIAGQVLPCESSRRLPDVSGKHTKVVGQNPTFHIQPLKSVVGLRTSDVFLFRQTIQSGLGINNGIFGEGAGANQGQSIRVTLSKRIVFKTYTQALTTNYLIDRRGCPQHGSAQRPPAPAFRLSFQAQLLNPLTQETP
jgi:hypothetical protein